MTEAEWKTGKLVAVTSLYVCVCKFMCGCVQVYTHIYKQNVSVCVRFICMDCSGYTHGCSRLAQPGEENTPGRFRASLKRAGEGSGTRAWSDGTRGNGFKLKGFR